MLTDEHGQNSTCLADLELSPLDTSAGGIRGVLDLEAGLSAHSGTESATREKGVSPEIESLGLEVCKKRLYDDDVAGMAQDSTTGSPHLPGCPPQPQFFVLFLFFCLHSSFFLHSPPSQMSRREDSIRERLLEKMTSLTSG